MMRMALKPERSGGEIRRMHPVSGEKEDMAEDGPDVTDCWKEAGSLAEEMTAEMKNSHRRQSVKVKEFVRPVTGSGFMAAAPDRNAEEQI